MDEVCKKQGELISLQYGALKKALPASKRNGERRELTGKKLDEAVEQRILSPQFVAYGSGFKAVWCNFYCPSSVCENRYDKPDETEEYDIWRIRERMTGLGLLPLYAEIEPEIRTEVSRNKYFLSQKVGNNVGWDRAEEDYLQNHFKDFLEGVTACFVEVGLRNKKRLEELLAAKQ